jgi:type IV pilus assembly protein PilB
MNLTFDQLQDLLVRPGHISESAFQETAREAQHQELDLSELLVSKGLIQENQLGQLLANEYGFQFIDLKIQPIDEQIMQLIPEPVARTKGVFAFSQTQQGIQVGMLDPNDLETQQLLLKRIGQKIIPYLITRHGLRSALAHYQKNLKEKFDQILKQLENPQLKREKRDQVTVQIVDLLLEYAYRNQASDIHIEPQEHKVLVRFRIDGVMHEILDIPKKFLDFILTRIKILSRLRTDEHQASQDGKFKFNIEDENVDVRISIVPVTKGENIVMRLLTGGSEGYSLSSLGMSDTDFKKIQRVIQNPHGMVLVSGPTGSGKTTSVYAAMRVLNNPDVHVASIEDPVEYDIKGITQIQVNPDTNLSFAEGLRALVRQDPDIIMVGEIRDKETADIAINSAMTGHLVLSTMHANDAVTTLIRLIEMGVEPFLVASTINVVIAQRLVRKICTSCRSSFKLSDEQIASLSENLKTLTSSTAAYEKLLASRMYKGKGCDICDQTGYQGRLGIFEILEINESIKDLVMKQAGHGQILKIAKSQGMTTMFDDGLAKVKTGITTLEEVVRVVRE